MRAGSASSCSRRASPCSPNWPDERPVLCLADDAHWLDSASAEALGFVARRLACDRIALLFGARDGDVRRFEGADLPSLTLPPLDPGAAALLLRRSTDSASTTVAERILHQRAATRWPSSSSRERSPTPS